MQVWWERTREVNRRMQLVRAAEWRVRLCFGFLPNLALSINKNVQEVMGDTSLGCYFLKAINTAFHDLTKGELLPPTTTSLLGLSLKFIPTPRYAPSATDIAPFLDQIEHDVGLKTFFTGRDQGEEIPMLRAKSSWHPPLPPRLVDYRINRFLHGMRAFSDGELANKTSPHINHNSWPPFERMSWSLLPMLIKTWDRWGLTWSITSKWGWTICLIHPHMSC